jgi:acyl carrier protein
MATFQGVTIMSETWSDHSQEGAEINRMPAVLGPVRAFLAEVLNIRENEIGPDALIVDDLHADSLDLLEFIGFAERRWNIVIQEPDLQFIRTVGDACDLIERMGALPADASEDAARSTAPRDAADGASW